VPEHHVCMQMKSLVLADYDPTVVCTFPRTPRPHWCFRPSAASENCMLTPKPLRLGLSSGTLTAGGPLAPSVPARHPSSVVALASVWAMRRKGAEEAAKEKSERHLRQYAERTGLGLFPVLIRVGGAPSPLEVTTVRSFDPRFRGTEERRLRNADSKPP
jgi:hypothetical protein